MSCLGVWAGGAVIVLMPLALLVVFPFATFQRDWINNLWMIAYMRDYLLVHGRMPDTFNVAAHVGIAQPIFYGPLLYPWLTVLSVPLGASAAVRVACAGVWGLQYVMVYRIARVAGAKWWEAMGAGALMSWAVYPLTNLYNRGALAEFFATSFLVSAVAAGGLALMETEGRWRRAFGILFVLLVALAFGSHAPTALLGGLVLSVLGVAALPLILSDGRGARRGAGLCAVAVIVLAALSPWLYVTWKMSGHLSIEVPSEFYPIAGKWQRFAQIDSWEARLEPLPLARRADFPVRDTPYVDAQWNFALAVIAGWNLWLSRRRGGRFRALMLCSAGLCAALVVLSISPTLQAALPHSLGGAIQFPYRLVSEVNLLLFAALIAAWAGRGSDVSSPGRERADRAIVLSMVVLAVVALGMKLVRAEAVASVDDIGATDNSEALLQLPLTYVGQDDYTVQVPQRLLGGAAAAGSAMIDSPRGLGPRGEVAEVSYVAPQRQWVVSSVLNFPWNRLIVDGKAAPFEEVHNLYFHEAVEVGAGGHTFGYRFEPDGVWVGLCWVSRVVMGGLVAATAGAAGWAVRGKEKTVG